MAIESIETRFAPILAKREAEALYRRRPLVTSPQTAEMQINGLQVINFSSNDYLGLANHFALKQRAKTIEDLSYGSGAAHLVTGHHLEHHLLEDELADWLGCDRALLFSTGYMANLAVQQTLMQKGDWILADKLNHASLIDGARYSEADLKRYPHLDMLALEKRLQKAQQENRQCLIVTDGVFSMDGDCAPLQTIQALAKTYQAWLFLDDAHGLGTLGEQGKGTLAHFNLAADENTIIMGTLGKAFGAAGAFIAGSEVLIETLIQTARPYIYTTAMPPINARVARTALRQVQQADTEREQLKCNIKQFQNGATKIGLTLWPSDSAIQPIMLGSSQQAVLWSDFLKQQGLWVTAIRPPTVPKNTARLRVTLSAAHTDVHIKKLLHALARCQDDFPSSNT